MKGLSRLLGAALYLFLAFPLLLGGLALASVRPLTGNPETFKSMVTDQRFSTLLESPDLVAMAPETLEFGGTTLDGKAAVTAFQASVPSRVIVSTAEDAIDSAFAAIERREAFFSVDARPLKGALIAVAPRFADTYLETARLPVVVALPGTAVATSSRPAVAALVVKTADEQPDEWVVGEPGSRLEAPARFGALGAGLSGASIWLIITGTGLCFASVLIAESSWRRRLGRLGTRILVPGIMVLVIGLVPHLIIPGGIVRLPSGVSGATLPDLAEYLRFVMTKIGGGFLTTGLISLGVGTAFISAKRAIPATEDEVAD
jgi:hypothetical protein